jgi:hypothetical protein
MKIVIIGAGWFGNYLASKFKTNNEVVLLEEKNRIMMNAATKNQNRLHLGFHYARSDDTIIQSKRGFDKFKNEFPFLSEKIKDNIYTISKSSIVTPEEYLNTMDKHGLKYDILTTQEENNMKLKNNNLSIRVDEEFILAKKAQKYFTNLNSDVLRCNEKVIKVDKVNKTVTTQNNNIYSYDVLINATYNDTNKLYENTKEHKPLKYEYCVLPIYKSKKIHSNKFALTIMDGPFSSLYPYRKHFFTLSSVISTPLGVYKENISEKEELELWEHLRNDYFVNKKYKDMEEQFYEYIDRNFVGIKYFNEFFVRKVKYLYDECDRRDTTVLYDNNIVTIYPGKIDSIIDTYEEICILIGEDIKC